jgi:hypothetical protein
VLSPARRQELVREGIALFHAGRFFAAHEAWEEVWRSTTPEPRDLFQGLVQLAAAFHHLHARRRPDVARRVLAKATKRLAGVVEPGLLAELARWDDWLAASVGAPPPPPRLDWLLGEAAAGADQPDDSGRRAR